MKSLVTVILPVYNCEKYLSEAIESILNQDYRDIEFIIINDGSNDRSLEIIKDYAAQDERIIVISRENKGLVYTLNEGLSKAQGTYIARMDADDICYPDRIAKQVQFFEANNKVDIVSTCVEVFGDVPEENRIFYEKKLNIPFNAHAEKVILTHWYCMAHPSVMAKKDVLLKLKGYNTVCAEDLDLWLRALKGGYIIEKLPDKLLKYRLHYHSKTNTDKKDYMGIKDGIRLKLEHVFGKIKNSPLQFLIWGTGNGGKITNEVIAEYYPSFRLIGFLDNFKSGNCNGVPIYHPSHINTFKSVYIFVATEPGKEEAINFLSKNGLKNIVDYLCTI